MSFQVIFWLMWPAGVVFIAGAIGGLLSALKVEPRRLKTAFISALIPLVLPASILLCGALFWYDSGGKPSKSAEIVITILLLANLPLGVLLAVFQRGMARLFVLSVSTVIFGYSIGAWIASGMAITGDWL
jgi:hypothetical protein